MTGIDHQDNPPIEQAAIWLADQRLAPQPVIPALQARFGLTAREACEATALADRYRVLRSAFA